MKSFFFLLLALGSSVFFAKIEPVQSFFHSATAATPDIPEPQKLMGNIIDKTAKEISDKYGFMPIGVGMSGQFHRVSISFRVFHPVDKNEMRKTILNCAEILLNNINDLKEIQPYLDPQPFTLENVGISIFASDKNYDPFVYPYPSSASLGRGSLEYYFEEEGNKYGYKEITKETYEEARALLKATH